MAQSLGIFTLFCLYATVVTAQDGNGANAGYTNPPAQGGGMSSKPLVFSTILFEPYTMENEDRSAVGNDRYVGFIPDLVKELADRLDFEYELRLVKDNKWGARDQSTGNWNGMIGEVIRGEVDMAAAPITVSDIRKSVVDFTSVIQEVSLTALVKSGSNLRDLDDMLASNFTYGDIEGGNTAKALQSSPDPQISTLWSRIASNDGIVRSAEEGRERAKKGGYAFILENPIAEYYVAQDCGLETTSSFYQLPGFAFPAAKYYPDMPKFNQALAALKRDGKIDALIDTWWAPQPCSASRGVVISMGLLLVTFLMSFIA